MNEIKALKSVLEGVKALNSAWDTAMKEVAASSQLACKKAA